MRYSYETFPGQVIVRTCKEGYTLKELKEEIRRNCEGALIVTTNERRTDKYLERLAGTRA